MKRLIARWIALAALGIAAPALADDYAREWGPEVGTPMPVLEAQDQTGQVRGLSNLAGEQGLLLFLNRSADW